jgi:Mg/Co/Ni transporter MgtE
MLHLSVCLKGQMTEGEKSRGREVHAAKQAAEYEERSMQREQEEEQEKQANQLALERGEEGEGVWGEEGEGVWGEVHKKLSKGALAKAKDMARLKKKGLANMSAAEKAAYLRGLGTEERARLLEGMTEEERAAYLNSLSEEERAQYLASLSEEGRRKLLPMEKALDVKKG